MKLVTRERVEQYLGTDLTRLRMDQLTRADDEGLTCQRWLRESESKRFIFNELYGDLFEEGGRGRILDVGGGLTCFTRDLAMRHDYFLVDLLAHDNVGIANALVREAGRQFVFQADWHDLARQPYDLIIANDIFPNVDQRLELFLARCLPLCRRLRISVTWYDSPRFYLTRRMDGEEMFYMLAWDRRQLGAVLSGYAGSIVNYDLSVLEISQPSLYQNGRQVCIVDLVGNLGAE